MFLKNFKKLYRYYRLEKRMRKILTIYFKYKLLIYSKVFIFALLYSLGFITINLIQIIFHINYFIDGFFYIYYMNVALELLFGNILCIIFFPTKISFLYYLRININFTEFIFFGEIRRGKEKKMKLSKLKKNILKEEYLKYEYPLILINPFAKTDKAFKGKHIHIGLVKRV